VSKCAYVYCTCTYMYVYSSTTVLYCVLVLYGYYHMIDTVLVLCILIPMLRISTVHKIWTKLKHKIMR
jgi:hypothetical protein